jgi:hypothetical protein
VMTEDSRSERSKLICLVWLFLIIHQIAARNERVFGAV